MAMARLIREKFWLSWKPFLAIILITTGIMLLVFLLGAVYGVSVRDLTRDPAAITGYPAYVGFVSQLGILIWSAAVVVCFLGYKIFARRVASSVDELRFKQFLFCSGLVTLMLGVDDAFMLHDRIFPHLGVHELIVYGSYALAILVYLVFFAPIIIKTEFLLLMAGLGFFALSMLTDLIYEPKYSPFWLEDGSKMVGILCWLAYYFRTVSDSLKAEAHTRFAATWQPVFAHQSVGRHSR